MDGPSPSPNPRNQRPDDPEGLRQFKAEFFKALAHPLRIRILELLRDQGPLAVGAIQEAAGAPASSISQQLAVLRARGIVVSERRGTTVIYRERDPDVYVLLEVARRIFNTHLSDTIDLLRMVEAEPVAEGPAPTAETQQGPAHGAVPAETAR